MLEKAENGVIRYEGVSHSCRVVRVGSPVKDNICIYEANYYSDDMLGGTSVKVARSYGVNLSQPPIVEILGGIDFHYLGYITLLSYLSLRPLSSQIPTIEEIMQGNEKSFTGVSFWYRQDQGLFMVGYEYQGNKSRHLGEVKESEKLDTLMEELCVNRQEGRLRFSRFTSNGLEQAFCVPEGLTPEKIGGKLKGDVGQWSNIGQTIPVEFEFFSRDRE